MNGAQKTVMWLGFSLIVIRLFTTNQWKLIWQEIDYTPSSSNPAANGGSPNFWSPYWNPLKDVGSGSGTNGSGSAGSGTSSSGTTVNIGGNGRYQLT